MLKTPAVAQMKMTPPNTYSVRIELDGPTIRRLADLMEHIDRTFNLHTVIHLTPEEYQQVVPYKNINQPMWHEESWGDDGSLLVRTATSHLLNCQDEFLRLYNTENGTDWTSWKTGQRDEPGNLQRIVDHLPSLLRNRRGPAPPGLRHVAGRRNE